MILLEIGTPVVPYYTGHAYGHACKQTHFDVKGACELPCTGGWYDAFYKSRRTELWNAVHATTYSLSPISTVPPSRNGWPRRSCGVQLADLPTASQPAN